MNPCKVSRLREALRNLPVAVHGGTEPFPIEERQLKT